MKTLIILVFLYCSQLALGYLNPITDIESFKQDLKEPYKSFLEFGIQGVRGFRDGFVKEYHHGKQDAHERAEDAKCFSEESEI
jgi:hypothetical protein